MRTLASTRCSGSGPVHAPGNCASTRHVPTATSNSRCRFLLSAQRVDAAHDAVELDQLAVPIAGEQFLKRRARRLGHATRAQTGDARALRLSARNRRARAALDGHPIAQAHLEWQARIWTKMPFLGVLHEQQRPGRIDVSDDPFDPHGTSQRGRIADANLGDGGQTVQVPGAGCRVRCRCWCGCRVQGAAGLGAAATTPVSARRPGRAVSPCACGP